MSHDAAASFVLDYELSADDVRAWLGADRSARRRRTSAARTMTFSLVFACAGTVAWLVLTHELVSCVSAEPTPRYVMPQVWLWQCDPQSPSALLWNNGGLFAAVVVLWCIGIGFAAGLWHASPARQARRWIASQNVAGRHRDEISAAGVTSVNPDGVTTFLPWSVVSSVLETDQRFFLLGTTAQAKSMLPKRGLPDPDSVPELGDFLRASAAGSSADSG